MKTETILSGVNNKATQESTIDEDLYMAYDALHIDNNQSFELMDWVSLDKVITQLGKDPKEVMLLLQKLRVLNVYGKWADDLIECGCVTTVDFIKYVLPGIQNVKKRHKVHLLSQAGKQYIEVIIRKYMTS